MSKKLQEIINRQQHTNKKLELENRKLLRENWLLKKELNMTIFVDPNKPSNFQIYRSGLLKDNLYFSYYSGNYNVPSFLLFFEEVVLPPKRTVALNPTETKGKIIWGGREDSRTIPTIGGFVKKLERELDKIYQKVYDRIDEIEFN